MYTSRLSPALMTIACILFLIPGLAPALTPDETVTATTQEVLTRLDRDHERLQADPDHIKVIVRELIVPHLDFQTMAGMILGKNWEILSEAMRECFTAGFRNLLVERYSDILLSYRNQDIHYAAARPIGDQGYMSVLQTLTRGERKPLTIGYPMRPDGDHWSVVDLVVDDVSLVRSYRLMFENEIQRQGLADFLLSFPECH
jgi:phospholipid transport system substrate-binding protein